MENNALLQHIADAAMRDRGLLTAPPPEALAEAAASAALPPTSDGASDGIRDLRSLPWTSIDNVESRDLDQIEQCEPTHAGVLLRVAIADVDHFAPVASATDRYAGHNTTSVYTGVRTYPMLPERLS